jgi:transposase
MLIARIRQGESARTITQALGISVRTVRKWVARERAS